MSIKITSYNAVCNLGNSIKTIYDKAIEGDSSFFKYYGGLIKNEKIYAGAVYTILPEIENEDYNLKCNRFALKTIRNIKEKITEAVNKYGEYGTALIAAGSYTGVNEFEISKNPKHCEPGNTAEFLHGYFGLKGFYTSVSAECASGIKAFSLARDLLNAGMAGCVILVCTDTLVKAQVYGFHALGVLSDKPSLPFGKNRTGINLGEGCAVFIIEKDVQNGIEISGIGEEADILNGAYPDIKAEQAVKAINGALRDAGIKPCDVDYINAHGSGTIADDFTEARAINKIFGENTPVSSTKPLTGYCSGAASGIETALCCALPDNFSGRLYPNVNDGVIDDTLDKIRLVRKNEKYPKCETVLCNSFGFGGACAAMVLKKTFTYHKKEM